MQEQLAQLVEATGLTESDVVRAALADYWEKQVLGRKSGRRLYLLPESL